MLHPVVDRDANVADLPQLGPRPLVALQRLGEGAAPADRPHGVRERLADRPVARGVEGDHLLDARGFPSLDIEGENLVDIVLHAVQAAAGPGNATLVVDTGAGRIGDVDAGLAGANLQPDDVGVGVLGEAGAGGVGGDRVEMTALQLAVAGHAPVQDAPIERGHDLHPAGPVLGRDPPLHPRPVLVGHTDETVGLQPRQPARPVAEAEVAAKHGATQIKLVPVGEQLDGVHPDGFLTLDAKLQQEPVGEIYEILVQDGNPGHDRGLPVVAAVDVGTRVMHVLVGLGPGK